MKGVPLTPYERQKKIVRRMAREALLRVITESAQVDLNDSGRITFDPFESDKIRDAVRRLRATDPVRP